MRRKVLDCSLTIHKLWTVTGTIFMECDDAILSLGFDVIDLGCCKCVSHSTWGTHAFLATIFTRAPVEAIEKVIEQVTQKTTTI
jgi:hypothetical protein